MNRRDFILRAGAAAACGVIPIQFYENCREWLNNHRIYGMPPGASSISPPGTAEECREPVVLDESDLRELRERGHLRGSSAGELVTPLIGYDEPEGFERIDITGEDWPDDCKYICDGKGAYFIDISGYGAPDEPALTFGELCRVLRPGYGYGLLETGEFQAYLGVYRGRVRD